MGLIFLKRAKRWQKILTCILIASTVGALYALLNHDFVAIPFTLRVAEFFSLGITSVLMVERSIYYLNNRWRAKILFAGFSRFKATLYVLFMPLLVFGLIWINIAISIPRMYTSIFGVESTRNDTALKHYRRSRRHCDYRLNPKSIDPFIFHFCISERRYGMLPSDEIEVELKISSSVFGYIVQEIRPIGVDH